MCTPGLPACGVCWRELAEDKAASFRHPSSVQHSDHHWLTHTYRWETQYVLLSACSCSLPSFVVVVVVGGGGGVCVCVLSLIHI